LTLRNIVTGERFASQPLMLVDGIPVSDANTIMRTIPCSSKISLS
jgi:hypothetical protein